MASIPDTRLSLIGRLSDFEDRQAWDEFVALYRPLIYSLALRSGLQAADAEDAVQEVLWAVGKSVAKWRPDPTRARFRTWLARITRNLVINLLVQQRRRAWNLSEADLQSMLWTVPHAPCGEESRQYELAFRRRAFALAAEKVQTRVEPKTWAAFRRTAIEGASITVAAEELGLERGMIYVARCRVMRMLRDAVEEFEGELESHEPIANGLFGCHDLPTSGDGAL